MKKFMLVLLVSLFPVALIYAQTNHRDLTQRVSSAVADAQMGDEDEEAEPENEEEPANEILQQYVDLCDGNEKLGQILYDVREGKTPRANARGRYVLWKERGHSVEGDLTLTGFVPFHTTKGINRYYPDGVWTTKDGAVKHIPGPLVGVLTGYRIGDDTEGDALWADFTYYGGFTRHKHFNTNFHFSYAVYNEKNEKVFEGKKNQTLRVNGEFLGKEFHFINFKIHYITLINELAPFSNEAAAQKFLDKQKSDKEKADRNTKRKQSIKTFKEKWFH